MAERSTSGGDGDHDAHGGGYRGELDAAHARIAALEGELAAERAAQALPEVVRARVAELEAARAVAVSTLAAYDARTPLVLATSAVVGLLGTGGFVASIAMLGDSGHPVNAGLLGLALTLFLVGVVAAIRRAVRWAVVGDVTRAQQRIDAVHAAGGGPRVRVDPTVVAAGRAAPTSPVSPTSRAANDAREALDEDILSSNEPAKRGRGAE